MRSEEVVEEVVVRLVRELHPSDVFELATALRLGTPDRLELLHRCLVCGRARRALVDHHEQRQQQGQQHTPPPAPRVAAASPPGAPARPTRPPAPLPEQPGRPGRRRCTRRLDFQIGGAP